MSRSNDSDARRRIADGAPDLAAPDQAISAAMDERRRQYLARRGAPTGGNDTAAIQARLAAARAAERKSRRTSR